jgi:hypothetical protein
MASRTFDLAPSQPAMQAAVAVRSAPSAPRNRALTRSPRSVHPNVPPAPRDLAGVRSAAVRARPVGRCAGSHKASDPKRFVRTARAPLLGRRATAESPGRCNLSSPPRRRVDSQRPRRRPGLGRLVDEADGDALFRQPKRASTNPVGPAPTINTLRSAMVVTPLGFSLAGWPGGREEGCDRAARPGGRDRVGRRSPRRTHP